jgi:hypothetical protein
MTRDCGESQAKNVHPLGLQYFPPIRPLRESGFLPTALGAAAVVGAR